MEIAPSTTPRGSSPLSASPHSGSALSDSALPGPPPPPAADPTATAGSPAGTAVPAARQHFSPVPTADTHEPATRHEENGQVVWRVQCGDLIGRERCMTVYVDDDEVVLVGPPGEAARLTRTQLGHLTAALDEAAGLAER